MALSTSVAATKAPARKARGEGHTRREEILAAAKALFLEQGVQATTIRRIAERVGVSAPALYLYFKDKDAILLELCDRTFGLLLARLEDIEHQPLPARERLRRMAEAYIRFGLDHPDEYRITFLEAQPPEAIRYTGHRTDTSDPGRPGAKGALAFLKIVQVYDDLVKEGVALPYSTITCAELGWMTCHGLVTAFIREPDFPWSDRDLLIRGIVEVSVRGIVPEM